MYPTHLPGIYFIMYTNGEIVFVFNNKDKEPIDDTKIYYIPGHMPKKGDRAYSLLYEGDRKWLYGLLEKTKMIRVCECGRSLKDKLHGADWDSVIFKNAKWSTMPYKIPSRLCPQCNLFSFISDSDYYDKPWNYESTIMDYKLISDNIVEYMEETKLDGLTQVKLYNWVKKNFNGVSFNPNQNVLFRGINVSD